MVGIGVLGLLVGAGIGASGKGSTKTITATTTVQAAAPAATRTVVHSIVHTQTVTSPAQTVTTTAPETKPAESSSAGSYSGSGEKNLGTITVANNSTIHWQASGGLFAIDNAPEDSQTINLTSQASSGETAIEEGTYHKVVVHAVGEWSFTITPG